MIEIYFDGSCRPKNPGGTASFGVIVRRDGELKASIGRTVGSGSEMSNNVGEYWGLIFSLSYLLERGWENEEIVVRGDSQLVINQMFGTWKIREGLYREYAVGCKKLLAKFPKIRGEWIEEAKNEEAHRLAFGGSK